MPWRAANASHFKLMVFPQFSHELDRTAYSLQSLGRRCTINEKSSTGSSFNARATAQNSTRSMRLWPFSILLIQLWSLPKALARSACLIFDRLRASTTTPMTALFAGVWRVLGTSLRYMRISHIQFSHMGGLDGAKLFDVSE